MNVKTLLPIIVAVVLFGGFYYFVNNQKAEESPEDVSTVDMTQDAPKDVSNETPGPGPVKVAQYIDYSEEALAQAHADGKEVVLFFHAAWCPTCRALDSELRSDEISSLSSDIVILKTDYDTQLELRQKYGITIQHTLVRVDASGNELDKWVGGDVMTINSKFL